MEGKTHVNVPKSFGIAVFDLRKNIVRNMLYDEQRRQYCRFVQLIAIGSGSSSNSIIAF